MAVDSMIHPTGGGNNQRSEAASEQLALGVQNCDGDDGDDTVDTYEAVVQIYLLLLERVNVPLSHNLVKSQNIKNRIIDPLHRYIRKKKNSDAFCLPFACLCARGIYQILAKNRPRHADIHTTRADIAELLSIRIVQDLQYKGKAALTLAFCLQFTNNVTKSASDHLSAVFEGTVTKKLQRAQNNLRHVLSEFNESERLLETAARTEAKLFTANQIVQEMTDRLWFGHISWKGHKLDMPACSHGDSRDTGALIPVSGPSGAQSSSPTPPPQLGRASTTIYGTDLYSTSQDRASEENSLLLIPNTANGNMAEIPTPNTLFLMPDGARYSWLEIKLAKILLPLRIPCFQNSVVTIHFAFFLFFHFMTLYSATLAPSWYEILFCLVAFAQMIDEARQVRESGLIVYSKNLWNAIDIIIYSVVLIYMALRIASLGLVYMGGADNDVLAREYTNASFDFLSLIGIILWPRLLAVLDQYEFFGTLVIQIKHMIQSTGLFIVVLVIVSMGFFQTFWLLSIRYQKKTWSDIGGMMVLVFFGNSYSGFEMAPQFGSIVGRVVMGMYIGISVLVLYNILIGVINQAYASILDNAKFEFHFAKTVKVLEFATAHTAYSFVPPFNLIQLAMNPLKRLISVHKFVLARSLVLVVIYSPHLLTHYIIKQMQEYVKTIGAKNDAKVPDLFWEVENSSESDTDDEHHSTEQRNGMSTNTLAGNDVSLKQTNSSFLNDIMLQDNHHDHHRIRLVNGYGNRPVPIITTVRSSSELFEDLGNQSYVSSTGSTPLNQDDFNNRLNEGLANDADDVPELLVGNIDDSSDRSGTNNTK
ncbi:hypothetical protein H4219_000084 [Mycoemilia scoparia]|uniref:Calcium channel YVC1-like C-terminal transmembrane domain-containing protein n=1 Tax=Mycoemilia scoparia TaxID=417184 RepID=A0A9W8A7M8_9FUNG|nr:hypothetical protein H4219_000084 [Mycoemilia scoparia]